MMRALGVTMRFLCFVVVLPFTAHAQILATVGGTKITVEDFNRKFEEVRRLAPNPPTSEQFLEDLVRYELGVQEAEKNKLQNEPMVRERLRQVLYNGLLEKQIGKRVEDIKITENEMRDYYKKNPQIRIAQILIETKPGGK